MLIRPKARASDHALVGGRVAIRAPVLALAVAVAAFWSTACSSDAPTSVEGVDIRAAKGGGGGGGGGKPGGGGGGSGDPTVKSADPPSAPQDITLDVRVLGSGFDDGSVARFLLNGAPVPGVVTNATRFVSKRELVANLTIATDAPTDFYDVEVTTVGGKRGVGIELFEVTATAIELAGLSESGGSTARAINDAAVIVGSSRDGGSRFGLFRAVRWRPEGGGWGAPEVLAVGYSGESGATGINEAGFIAGNLYEADGESRSAVVWRPDGTQVVLGEGSAVDINENNTVVGFVDGVGYVAWRYDPSSGDWRREVIAAAVTEAWVNGISDEEVAVGAIRDGNLERAVYWTYASGVWNGPNLMDHAGAPAGWVMDATDAGVAGGLWVQGEPDCGNGIHPAAAVWESPTAAPILIPGLEGKRSWVEGINSHGVVVGGLDTSAGCIGASRALVWSFSAGLRLLAPLPGYGWSEAYGVNDAGQVVGVSRGGSSERAVVWVLP